MPKTKVLKILLAAGNSKRYGPKNKLLELLYDKKIIEHSIENLLKIFNNTEILAITGYQSKKVELSLKKYGIKTSFNKNYCNGIGTSISHAMKISDLNVDGVMFVPGDMPLISNHDYQKIIKAFKNNNHKKIICPQYENQNGSPLILPRTYFQMLKSLKEDMGAKKFLPSNNFFFVKTGYGTTFDIDCFEDLKKAKSLIKSRLESH